MQQIAKHFSEKCAKLYGRKIVSRGKSEQSGFLFVCREQSRALLGAYFKQVNNREEDKNRSKRRRERARR